jgi:hypothetical protein
MRPHTCVAVFLFCFAVVATKIQFRTDSSAGKPEADMKADKYDDTARISKQQGSRGEVFTTPLDHPVS